MLFWNEVKKLWRQRTAKVFLALAAALLLFLCIMNIKLGSSAFFYSGPENTALQKQYAQRWKGPLTGEKLAEALAFYQQGYADESKLVYDEQWGAWEPSNEQYAAYLIPTMDVLAPLESVRMPEILSAALWGLYSATMWKKASPFKIVFLPRRAVSPVHRRRR